MKPYGEFVKFSDTLEAMELSELISFSEEVRAAKQHYERGLDALRRQQERLLKECRRRERLAKSDGVPVES